MTARLLLLAVVAACACAVAPGVAGARPRQSAAGAPAATAAHPAAQAAPAAADAAIDAAFKAWDSDHDGVLSQGEFRAGMNLVRRRREERAELALRLREQFDKVDANHNGGIDAGEYGSLTLVHDAGKGAPALSAFDRNGDRRLEFAEYLALVGRLAPAHRAAGKAP